MGPMTGRGVGYCGGYGVPGYASPMPGRGFGMGWGRGCRGGWWRGRGWARFGYEPAWGAPPAAPYGPYAAAPTPEQMTEVLKAQAEWLKEQLDAISQRITELGQGK